MSDEAWMSDEDRKVWENKIASAERRLQQRESEIADAESKEKWWSDYGNSLKASHRVEMEMLAVMKARLAAKHH